MLKSLLGFLKKYASYEIAILLIGQFATVGLFLGGLASPLTAAVIIIPLSLLVLLYKRLRQLSHESLGAALNLIDRLERLLEHMDRAVITNNGAVQLFAQVTFDSELAQVDSAGIRNLQVVFQHWLPSLKSQAGLLRRTFEQEPNRYFLTQAVNDMIVFYQQYMSEVCNRAIQLCNNASNKRPELWPTFNGFRQNMWELRGAINPFLVDCQRADLSPNTIEVSALTADLDPPARPAVWG